MVNSTTSLREGMERGAIKLAEGAVVSHGVRFILLEDDGSSAGVIRIGEGVKIREGAIICSGVEIGKDTIIGHHCVIRRNVVIGEKSLISHMTCLEREVTIGAHVRISALTHITGGCVIDDHVQIGARVVTVNDNEMRWGKGAKLKAQHLQEGSRIGSGTTLLGNVIVGRNAFIGAGSVVTRNIPDNSLAYGNPAYIHGDNPPNDWKAGASLQPI